MKRVDPIRRDPSTGVPQAVPRRKEIKEHLAKRITRLLSNPADEDDLP